MEVSLGYGMGSYSQATIKSLLNYFQLLESDTFDKVHLVDVHYQVIPDFEIEDNTLYVLNCDLPRDLTHYYSRCMSAPVPEDIIKYYLEPNSDFSVTIRSREHNQDYTLVEAIVSEFTKLPNLPMISTMDDPIPIAVLSRGSNKLWLTQNVFGFASRETFTEYLDLVLSMLFTNFRRVKWDELSDSEKLRCFYDASQYGVKGRRRELQLDIDNMEIRRSKIEMELSNLEQVYEDVKEELEDLDKVQVTFDYEGALRSLERIDRVRSVAIQSDHIVIELDDLSLGDIPLPPYIVTITKELYVSITTKDIDMLRAHPHLDLEGHPCWGELSYYTHYMITELDLASLVNIVIRFLGSYDDDNPYVPLMDWVKELAYQYVRIGRSDLAEQVAQSWNNMLDYYHGVPIKIIDGSIKVSEVPDNKLSEYYVDLSRLTEHGIV